MGKQNQNASALHAVELNKQFDQETTQAILKQFYHQVKRAVKKNEKTNVKLQTGEKTSQLTLDCNGFNLKLVLTDN